MWIKKGLIYAPNNDRSWSQTHATVPCADVMEEKGIVRIIFSTRNEFNQCLPTYLDLDINTLEPVSEITSEPLFPIGNIGTFDDCGVMPTWIYREGEKRYLFYIGWTVRNTIPYQNSLGLATSEDGISYHKKFSGPVLTTNHEDIYFTSTCCILKIEDKYVCWYLSCVGWEMINDKPEPRYDLKIAVSNDLINWERNGKVAINLKDSEGGICRPTVIQEDGIFKMWYSYRGRKNFKTFSEESYRIGYAESCDGYNWIRKDDEAKINVSESGWDSEMIEYPNVVNIKGRKIMFYNGNGFGKTGIGYAIWK